MPCRIVGQSCWAHVLALAVALLGSPAITAATLVGVDIDTDQLISIDPLTGVGTGIGPIGIGESNVESLAFDTSTNTLFGLGGDKLVTIDPATGAGTILGELGFGFASSIAYDTNTDTLYGLAASQELYTIDRATGWATATGINITSLGSAGPTSLAFDPATATLFALGRGSLYTIDLANNTFVLIGPVSDGSGSLAFDAGSGLLFSDAPGALLVSIEPSTGASTVVGAVGFGNVGALEFIGLPEPIPGLFWAMSAIIVWTRLRLRRGHGSSATGGQRLPSSALASLPDPETVWSGS